MEAAGKSAQKVVAKSATELFAGGKESPPKDQRPLLILRFWNNPKRELYHAEFHAHPACRKEAYIKQRDTKGFSFTWSKTAQALSVLFLEYACAGMENRAGDFSFPGERRGSLAATLADAMAKNTGYLIELFKEYPKGGGEDVLVEKVLDGHNLDGKEDNERRLLIHADYLPPERVEIYLEGRRLTEPQELRTLNDELRRANKLEPSRQPPPPPKPQKPATVTPRQDSPKQAEKPAAPAKQRDLTAGEFLLEFKQLPKQETTPKEEAPQDSAPPEPPAPQIDPKLFEIQNPDEIEWDDSSPLINFGRSDSTADVWTIRDASEGVLIMGSIGSGKTSGSGSAIATTLLQSGYGGLVLTAKTDEAKRWLRLCERSGRSADCIHVTPASGHKLNVLQYEVQRPGDRVSKTDDLLALFRAITSALSRTDGGESKDQFWTQAPDALMKNLIEVFTIANEPISVKSFSRFLVRAPEEVGQSWLGRGYFTEILNRARDNLKNGTDQDRLVFPEVWDYWTIAFPKTPDITRGGVIATFEAMASTMKGRGIYEMIGMETNLTPEMILSGKIVILDFPLKASVRGGYMVQSLWKLLYQQAIERRADKGKSSARPVFLWEDEGHLLFSEYDREFQPTARDCRACHVILSQNLRNFGSLGHNEDTVHSVFESMNTLIFHTNGDPKTNNWASEKIGVVKERHFSAGGLFKGFTQKDYSLSSLIFGQPPEGRSCVGNLSIEETEKLGMRPEEFSKLKKGGDGTCEAVILWLAHQFEINGGKQFCKRTFAQEPR
jgi:hypothetical protein